MSFYSLQTNTSSATTARNKVITASASASATSDISQADADAQAIKNATLISQISANTQASLINTSYLNKTTTTLYYYLNISEFIQSLVEVSTSLLPTTTTTTDALYIYGRAPIYTNDSSDSIGICSASFMCSKKSDTDIYTDITNYISVGNGLVVSWLTPARPANLELDSIVNSMVTECIVSANTKIGQNPFYGETFNLVVTSSNGKIGFLFTPYNN
jgi:hypothetical protein